MAKKSASNLSLDELQDKIDEIKTTLKDIEDDIKAKEKGMIKRYIDELGEKVGEAKKLFAKILG